MLFRDAVAGSLYLGFFICLVDRNDGEGEQIESKIRR